MSAVISRCSCCETLKPGIRSRRGCVVHPPPNRITKSSKVNREIVKRVLEICTSYTRFLWRQTHRAQEGIGGGAQHWLTHGGCRASAAHRGAAAGGGAIFWRHGGAQSAATGRVALRALRSLDTFASGSRAGWQNVGACQCGCCGARVSGRSLAK